MDVTARGALESAGWGTVWRGGQSDKSPYPVSESLGTRFWNDEPSVLVTETVEAQFVGAWVRLERPVRDQKVAGVSERARRKG